MKAVRGLVGFYKERGRTISYADAHRMVNARMGVESVEDMTMDMVSEGLKVVGELMMDTLTNPGDVMESPFRVNPRWVAKYNYDDGTMMFKPIPVDCICMSHKDLPRYLADPMVSIDKSLLQEIITAAVTRLADKVH